MKRQTVLIVISFFSIYVFWGSTYLWNKIAVGELAPFMLASIRFLTAGILIFIIAKALGYSLAISKKQFLNTLLAGFLFLAYGNGMFVWGLKYVDSGFGALIASLQPLFILLMMRTIQNKALKLKSWIGVSLGLLGMYLLVSQDSLSYSEGSVIGIIMILSAVLSWSIGSLFVAKAEMPKNFFVTTAYQMVLAGILLAISSFIIDEPWSAPMSWPTEVQWSMIGLVLFGSIAAFTSFNYLLKVVSTEKVSTSAYVNPIIALFLGWYFLNETITLQSMIAAAVLLTGVYFINTRKVKTPTKT